MTHPAFDLDNFNRQIGKIAANTTRLGYDECIHRLEHLGGVRATLEDVKLSEYVTQAITGVSFSVAITTHQPLAIVRQWHLLNACQGYPSLFNEVYQVILFAHCCSADSCIDEGIEALLQAEAAIMSLASLSSLSAI